ncbi:MAG TPA: DUF4402 domain-containing protein [Longimicrobiaceae bacterium]|nr:DUF4402 domain-containing protein [Longimicrobiaceae bacterium]
MSTAFALLGLMAAPAIASAQSTANADATVNATVIAALTITNDNGLDFGQVAKGASYTVDAKTGATAAKWTVGGEAGASISVSYDASIPLVAGTDTITVTPDVAGSATDTQSGATTLASGDSGTLDATTGAYYVWMGGSLTVPSAVAAGAYTGTATLTVTYN